VGIVFDKELFDKGQPCQRFFFGHDNDIQFLTIHPSRK
jgi:microtubule-associated protein-like 5